MITSAKVVTAKMVMEREPVCLLGCFEYYSTGTAALTLRWDYYSN